MPLREIGYFDLPHPDLALPHTPPRQCSPSRHRCTHLTTQRRGRQRCHRSDRPTTVPTGTDRSEPPRARETPLRTRTGSDRRAGRPSAPATAPHTVAADRHGPVTSRHGAAHGGVAACLLLRAHAGQRGRLPGLLALRRNPGQPLRRPRRVRASRLGLQVLACDRQHADHLVRAAGLLLPDSHRSRADPEQHDPAPAAHRHPVDRVPAALLQLGARRHDLPTGPGRGRSDQSVPARQWLGTHRRDDQPRHVRRIAHSSGDLEGRRMGHGGVPRGAEHRRPVAVRGSGRRRREPVAPPVARHAPPHSGR